jgi:flagellar biosynthesis/type III secretory pathway chaperone
VLKKSKSDELGVIDNKILALNDAIVKLNQKRKNLSMELLNKDGAMSDFIEFAEVNQPDVKEALMLRKVKICNIFEELALLNNQNVELIKHGIVITNKMLETIVNAFAPQGSIYNGAGKTTDTHELNMWTINEEI